MTVFNLIYYFKVINKNKTVCVQWDKISNVKTWKELFVFGVILFPCDRLELIAYTLWYDFCVILTMHSFLSQIAACYSHIQRTFQSQRNSEERVNQQLIKLCGKCILSNGNYYILVHNTVRFWYQYRQEISFTKDYQLSIMGVRRFVEKCIGSNLF